MTSAQWRASCLLSRVLCGERSRPLCSRIYTARDSRWRSWAMPRLDRLFRDKGHASRIHREWVWGPEQTGR